MIVQTKLKFLKANSGFTITETGPMYVVKDPKYGFSASDQSKLFKVAVLPKDIIWADSSRVRTFMQRVFGQNK